MQVVALKKKCKRLNCANRVIGRMILMLADYLLPLHLIWNNSCLLQPDVNARTGGGMQTATRSRKRGPARRSWNPRKKPSWNSIGQFGAFFVLICVERNGPTSSRPSRFALVTNCARLRRPGERSIIPDESR